MEVKLANKPIHSAILVKVQFKPGWYCKGILFNSRREKRREKKREVGPGGMPSLPEIGVCHLGDTLGHPGIGRTSYHNAMDDNDELESFRQQWREEVTRRSRPKAAPPAPAIPTPTAPPSARLPPTRHEASHRKEIEEEAPPLASFDPDELAQQVGELSVEPPEDDFSRREVAEPTSALEHFERAVQKEAEGNLGDSLSHYRKAYRVSFHRFKWHLRSEYSFPFS